MKSLTQSRKGAKKKRRILSRSGNNPPRAVLRIWDNARLIAPPRAVQGSRFKVQGSRFKVQGSRFKVQGSRFKVHRAFDPPSTLYFLPAHAGLPPPVLQETPPLCRPALYQSGLSQLAKGPNRPNRFAKLCKNARRESSANLCRTKLCDENRTETTLPNRPSRQPLTIRQRGPPHAAGCPHLRFRLSASTFGTAAVRRPRAGHRNAVNSLGKIASNHRIVMIARVAYRR